VKEDEIDPLLLGAVQNMLNIFVLPEIQRRQELGKLEKPLELIAAQVIFRPDGGKHEVRINSEVEMLAKVSLDPNVVKKEGEPVTGDEVQELQEVSLIKGEDEDCAHMTFLSLAGRLFFAFDARRNKSLIGTHLR